MYISKRKKRSGQQAFCEEKLTFFAVRFVRSTHLLVSEENCVSRSLKKVGN